MESAAIVGKFANAIEHIVNDLLANGVVATGVVVGRVLLATDQLLWVKEALVFALSNFRTRKCEKSIKRNKRTRIDNRRLQVDHDGTGDVLTGAS